LFKPGWSSPKVVPTHSAMQAVATPILSILSKALADKHLLPYLNSGELVQLESSQSAVTQLVLGSQVWRQCATRELRGFQVEVGLTPCEYKALIVGLRLVEVIGADIIRIRSRKDAQDILKAVHALGTPAFGSSRVSITNLRIAPHMDPRALLHNTVGGNDDAISMGIPSRCLPAEGLRCRSLPVPVAMPMSVGGQQVALHLHWRCGQVITRAYGLPTNIMEHAGGSFQDGMTMLMKTKPRRRCGLSVRARSVNGPIHLDIRNSCVSMGGPPSSGSGLCWVEGSAADFDAAMGAGILCVVRLEESAMPTTGCSDTAQDNCRAFEVPMSRAEMFQRATNIRNKIDGLHSYAWSL